MAELSKIWRGLLPSARTSSDELTALVLETLCLRGAVFTHGRSGWGRTASDNWPICVETPEASDESTPAGAMPEATDPRVGAMFAARSVFAASDVIMGLPTSLLLLRVLRMPSLAKDEMAGAVSLQMDKLSPFPGDELSVGWELLSDDGENATVIAAAVPSRHMESLDAALAASGLYAMRVDVALLGWLRLLREHKLLGETTDRQVVLVAHGDEWDLLVLDAGRLVLARGLGQPVDDGDMVRDLSLTLFQVEAESGARPVHEIVVVSDTPPSAGMLISIRNGMAAPLRCIAPPTDASAADGLCLRAMDGVTMDLVPSVWRDREQATMVRHRLTFGLAVAAGLWVALAATLFLGPIVADQIVRMQKRHEIAIHEEYQAVYDLRERVQLIHRYMDRDRSFLEAFRTLAAAQPPGVDLTSMIYQRDEGCKITGEALDRTAVYSMIDNLRTNRPFTSCKLGTIGPGRIRAGASAFDMEAKFGDVEAKP